MGNNVFWESSASLALAGARTERWLEALGALFVMAVIYFVVRFLKRAAEWRKKGLFEREKDISHSRGLEVPVKMSPNRKD